MGDYSIKILKFEIYIILFIIAVTKIEKNGVINF